jgi:hypothetical protein
MRFLLIMLIALSACKSGRNKDQAPQPPAQAQAGAPATFAPTDFMLLSKKKCRGKCQVFELRIQGNGMAELHATENMPRTGHFILSLQPEEAVKLFEMAESALTNMGVKYYPAVSDYQESTFQLATDRFAKIVEGRYQAPKEYLELLEMLESLPARDGWIEVKE